MALVFNSLGAGRAATARAESRWVAWSKAAPVVRHLPSGRAKRGTWFAP